MIQILIHLIYFAVEPDVRSIAFENEYDAASGTQHRLLLVKGSTKHESCEGLRSLL
jgi:hypothetical protein